MKLPWVFSSLPLLSAIVLSVTEAACDNPPSILNTINNVTGTSPYPQSTTVRYDCLPGYNPAGTSRFYTCTGTIWAGGNFLCEQIFCSHVEIPENGFITNSPTNEVGTTIRFACYEGHDMFGESATMICRVDGEWLPSTPPTCIAKYCGEFGSIQYADIFQDNSSFERNHYGSVVQVTCQDGRILIGPPSVECQADGQWGIRPTCEILQCPPYPNTNSPCVSSSENFGSYLFIYCNNNISKHFGPDQAECISGQWDSTEMGCLCDCIIPDYNPSVLTLKNLNNYGNLDHATALEWECHTGTSKHQTVNVLCIDGMLRGEENGNVIINANYTNPVDMNEIIPALCNLPITIASTTPPTSLTSASDDTFRSTISNNTTSKYSINSTMKHSNKSEHDSIEKLNSGAFCLSYAYCIYMTVLFSSVF